MLNEIFVLPDLLDLGSFLLSWVLLFGIIYLRYILVSAPFAWAVRRFRVRLGKRILHDHLPRAQVWRELSYAAMTAVLFSFLGMCFLLMWQLGLTAMVMEATGSQIIFYCLTFILALAIQETFYYWAHRWMHRPKIYRLLHGVHHASHFSNSFTAFSFHPLESLVQTVPLLLTLIFLPMHVYGVVALLLLMTISATVNHGGLELFPKGHDRHWLGKWFIGATHHHIHHQRYRCNYGLHFTFWDRWMGTEGEAKE